MYIPVKGSDAKSIAFRELDSSYPVAVLDIQDPNTVQNIWNLQWNSYGVFIPKCRYLRVPIVDRIPWRSYNVAAAEPPILFEMIVITRLVVV